MRKIAFLFLTIDDVHFPKLWSQYFNGQHQHINIYCHPKYPDKVTVPWLVNNIIPTLVETEWGYIVNAYHELLKHAMKDKDNVKFITLSESCVPLKKFSQLYREVMHEDHLEKSHIKNMNITTYDWETRIKTQKNHDKLNITWRKHYARFCLARKHVTILLNNPDKLNFFGKMHVGDEFFLSILGNDPDIIDFAITFDNWKRTKQKVDKIKQQIKQTKNKEKKNKLITLKEKTGRNPHSYDIVVKQDVREAYQSTSFFWRKFPKSSNIEQFMKFKLQNTWKEKTIIYPKRSHLKIEQLDEIDYYDENDKVINNIINERPEQHMANDYIMPDMKVLELGARYGTVSCVINNKLENPHDHVVIEPDKRVLKALIKNRKNHASKFTIINGVISKKPMTLIHADYATRTTNNDIKDDKSKHVIVNNYSIKQIMYSTKVKFDVLVADCEGCMCTFLEENGEYIKHYRMIIMEQDFPNLCDYNAVNKKLLEWKFKLIVKGFVNVWEK
jgi:FkbM family methyltransferase